MIRCIAVGLLLFAGYALSDDTASPAPSAPVTKTTTNAPPIDCTKVQNTSVCCSTLGCDVATCGDETKPSCHPLSHFEGDGECAGKNGTCRADDPSTTKAPGSTTTSVAKSSTATPAAGGHSPTTATTAAAGGKSPTTTTIPSAGGNSPTTTTIPAAGGNSPTATATPPANPPATPPATPPAAQSTAPSGKKPSTTTPAASTTPTSVPEKASEAEAGGFDKGSFFGGIALAVGVVVIICLARFFYRRRTNGRQYNRFI